MLKRHRRHDEEHAEQAERAEPSAAMQLAALEIELLGADCPRVDGAIERGVGSRFAELEPEQREHLLALEALCTAEAAHDGALAAMSGAAAAVAAAKDRLEVARKAAASHRKGSR